MTAEKNYEADEKKDKLIIKELIKKSIDFKDMARKFTEYFSKKYGAEFGGNVLFEYDSTGNVMIMTCYDQDRVFEVENELNDIATHLKFLRKTASYKKRTGRML